MQQQIAMDRNLSRTQFNIYRLSKRLGANDGLIQNIRLVVFAQCVSQMA